MSKEVFDWWEQDARLAEEEAERVTAENKAHLMAEAQRTDLDEWFHEMSIEEHEQAVRGMADYALHWTEDLTVEELEQGWHKHVVDTDDSDNI